MKKQLASIIAASVLSLGAVSSWANTGDQVIDFDTANIPGVSPDYQFSYDEFGLSPVGDQTVVQVDSDNNGVLSDGDAFTEMSLFSTNGFSLNGAPLFPQPGIGIDWQVLTGVTLDGFVTWQGAPGTSNLIVTFTSSTGGSMVVNNASPAAGPEEIATISLMSGTCEITAPTSAAQGSCLLTFDFNATIAGVFTAQGKGDLFGNDTDRLIVDINVNDLAGLSFAYDGFGDTCGAGSQAGGLCEQSLDLRHDGSAIHVVPAPGSLALIGLGLLGLTRLRSRKAA